MRLPIVIAIIVATMAAATAAAGYTSDGFEPPVFTTGALNGQGGWTQFLGGAGIPPRVVAAPEPVEGTQSVRLEVGDTNGDASEMDYAVSVTPAPNTVVAVSFDIYRVLPAEGKRIQNLWWYWYEYDAVSSPGYGIQWDGSVATHPFGFGSSSPIVFGQWATVTMVWDFTTMTASGWYNGSLVTSGPFTWDGRTFTGYGIYLAHDSATGTGPDTAWIDNFWIVDALGTKISDARSLPDGKPVGLTGKKVTAAPGVGGVPAGVFYIEEADRSSGIRVASSVAVSVGDTATVVGTIATTPGGERYIKAAGVTAAAGTTLAPLGANTRFVAGSLMEGLLIKTAGTVRTVGADFYTIADGHFEGGVEVQTKVITGGAPGVSLGQFVTVKGVASKDGTRVILSVP